MAARSMGCTRAPTIDGWRWRNDFTTYDEEVEYLREWVIDRWAYVDGGYQNRPPFTGCSQSREHCAGM